MCYSLKPFGWGIPFDDSFHYCCTMGTFVLDENKESKVMKIVLQNVTYTELFNISRGFVQLL